MHRPRSAYTLVEMLFAIAIFGMVSVGLFTFATASLRLVGRNLATNHSHEVMRISDMELLHSLHASASAFQLIAFDGTTYTDLTPTVTTDQDAFTPAMHQHAGQRGAFRASRPAARINSPRARRAAAPA